ncbi:MAG: UDP-2,3-diacylglucosamine diphosphatase [Methylophaga sp.]|nr:UDP-2,3-diacylglucosamine diphosphatase [Methylophaga sp.]
MRQLFISDLHLSPDQPDLTRLVTDFLLDQERPETLYILGDIFNTWLGDDLVLPEYQPFIGALKQLHDEGTQIYLMVGNRDFMLGKHFAEAVGAELLPDPVIHYFDDTPVLLMHGDSLCTDDVSYQRYRKVVRNHFLQWCFLRLPLRFRQNISDQIKAKSKAKKRSKTFEIMDVNQSTVETVMNAYEVNIMIHGHTHRPAIHNFQSQGQKKWRIVLGDWHDSPSFMVIKDGIFRLVDSRLEPGQLTLNLSA